MTTVTLPHTNSCYTCPSLHLPLPPSSIPTPSLTPHTLFPHHHFTLPTPPQLTPLTHPSPSLPHPHLLHSQSALHVTKVLRRPATQVLPHKVGAYAVGHMTHKHTAECSVVVYKNLWCAVCVDCNWEKVHSTEALKHCHHFEPQDCTHRAHTKL